MRQSARPSLAVMKKSTFFLTNGQPSFMICSLRGEWAAAQDAHRQLRRTVKARLKLNRGRQARIRMDEDKPRERDTQLPGLASAKRFLARTIVGGATQVRPTAQSAIFLAAVRP